MLRIETGVDLAEIPRIAKAMEKEAFLRRFFSEEERAYFRNLFSKKAQNSLVLLSTHIIEDLASVCSRLLIIRGGRILFSGSPGQLVQTAFSASSIPSAVSAPLSWDIPEAGAHALEAAYLRLISGEVAL